MRVIPRKARKITYSTEIRNLKQRLTLNDYQKAVVIGCLLGDGNLELNWSKTNYKLRFGHSVRQRDYLYWKYNLLRDWVLTKPRLNQKTKSLFFNTISHKELSSLGELFYKGSKKILPGNFSEIIKNPVTLAVWFMDDGNVIRRNDRVYGFHLNTQSFSYQENSNIITALRNAYGLNWNIEKNKKSIALNLLIQSQDKTLNDKEIDELSNKIIQTMQKSFDATLRS